MSNVSKKNGTEHNKSMARGGLGLEGLEQRDTKYIFFVFYQKKETLTFSHYLPLCSPYFM